MIHVVAVIKAKVGKREQVLSIANENLDKVRAEDGCIEYIPVVDAEFGLFQSVVGEDGFLVIEKWRDPEALKAHASAPHMIEYGKKVKDLLESRVIHVLQDAPE